MITPGEFKDIMQGIKDDMECDRELMHIEMDDLLCEVLNDLGYSEGVKIYKNTDMWHA